MPFIQSILQFLQNYIFTSIVFKPILAIYGFVLLIKYRKRITILDGALVVKDDLKSLVFNPLSDNHRV